MISTARLCEGTVRRHKLREHGGNEFHWLGIGLPSLPREKLCISNKIPMNRCRQFNC